MAEQSPAAVYAGSWWMSPTDIPDMENLEPFWPKDLMDMKPKSNGEQSFDGSFVFQDIDQKPGCDIANMSPDSAFQMMVTIFSDSDTNITTDPNPNLLWLQERLNTFSTTAGDVGLTAEKEAGHQVFGINQQEPLYGFQANSNNLNFVQSLPKRQVTDNFHLTNNTTFKRPRLETPSPLPTFKVRKEKLGDRITALQQLVSPFGKTDTASVLHEAIEYIHLLHDQVKILSAPYTKGATKQLRTIHDKRKDDQQRDIQDLTGQGLCLVPVSIMFPVATDHLATGF